MGKTRTHRLDSAPQRSTLTRFGGRIGFGVRQKVAKPGQRTTRTGLNAQGSGPFEGGQQVRIPPPASLESVLTHSLVVGRLISLEGLILLLAHLSFVSRLFFFVGLQATGTISTGSHREAAYPPFGLAWAIQGVRDCRSTLKP